MGYSLWLAARVLLYASSHRQDNTYHSLCYTSCGALAGTRNSSMGPPLRIAPWAKAHTMELHFAITSHDFNMIIECLMTLQHKTKSAIGCQMILTSIFFSRNDDEQNRPLHNIKNFLQFVHFLLFLRANCVQSFLFVAHVDNQISLKLQSITIGSFRKNITKQQ